MKQSTYDKQHKEAEKRCKQFQSYEKCFTRHKYNGRGDAYFKEITGSTETEVVVLAPLSVNNSNCKANKYSGALAILLAYETGCRTLFASKRFKQIEAETARQQCNAIISRARTKVIVELRTHISDEMDISINTVGDNKGFLKRLALYTIQYVYRDSNIIEISTKGSHSFMLEFLSKDGTNANNSYITDEISILIIDINEKLLDTHNEHYTLHFNSAYSVLKKIVTLLIGLDWTAEKYDVYRLWQADSKSQIPQDKIEFIQRENALFAENAFVHVCSSEGGHETARVNEIKTNIITELEAFIKAYQVGSSEEYVVLTNRLIELTFGHEWFEGMEELPGLRCAPVIVYENSRERYEIGIPKANQVDRIALSSGLFKEKMESSSKYDYLIFNSFSDSRIFIEVEKSDYQDNGRVKDKDGIPNAKKVMMPRYYRLMMGYIDKPLKTIRAEEYRNIILNLSEKNELLYESTEKKKLKYEVTVADFELCYKKIPGQAYFQLVEKEDVLFQNEKDNYDEALKRIIRYLEKIGAYSYVDLIRIPKKVKPQANLLKNHRNWRKKLWIKILKKSIGRSEYILKTSWAGDTDDKNSVARLNSNMMSLIGVSENDKILIKFGDNTIILRVLPNDDLTDYEIGIPSSGRRALKMNSINDIVIVHRDMLHTFKRHSQEQTIAILGTVLAVVQVLSMFSIFTSSLGGVVAAIIVCVFAIILMLYFALSEERVKVK